MENWRLVMANILAVSVSLKYASFALETDNRTIEGELHDDTPTFFVGAIRNFLKENGLKFQDLTKLIICSGPGSFTGLRVGMSFAKAVKEATGVEVISVNLFDILSHFYNADFMVINSENPNEIYYKIKGEEAESCRIDEFECKNFDSIVIEGNCPVVEKLTIENLSVCQHLRKAKNLLMLKNCQSGKLEPFYIKPPYAVKK